MCIIVAKKKDSRLPKEEELKNCFTRNSDGAGFMYVDNGKVIIDKGYMTYNSFIARFNQLCKKYNNFDNKALVVHCRIGTSSGNIDKNTHPYPISGKEKQLHKLYMETNLGMVHNGIIHDYTPTWANPTTNDTQEFIMKYVYPLYSNYPNFYKNKYIRKGLEDITGSKLVFLDTNDNLYFVGDFIEENNLQFSNTTYKSYQPTYYSGYSKGYSSYGYSDYYYDDDEWFKHWYKNDTVDKNETLEDDYSYETMMYLDSEWFISNGIDVEKVNNRDLMWDYNTLELFEINANNTLIKKWDNCIVYDENHVEVF